MPAVCNNVSWALWGSQGPCCKGNLVSERNIHIIYLQGKAEWKDIGDLCYAVAKYLVKLLVTTTWKPYILSLLIQKTLLERARILVCCFLLHLAWHYKDEMSSGKNRLICEYKWPPRNVKANCFCNSKMQVKDLDCQSPDNASQLKEKKNLLQQI